MSAASRRKIAAAQRARWASSSENKASNRSFLTATTFQSYCLADGVRSHRRTIGHDLNQEFDGGSDQKSR
jgi:hypothetical protein